MSGAADFDIGPLTWVKPEIDHALGRAAGCLRAFAETPADATQLRFAQTHLHQAHGALQIVGLDGVTKISEEIEGLLADIEKSGAAPGAETLKATEDAFSALTTYLGELLAGEPHQPLKLLAAYSALAKARGREAPDPVDLYFPDLSRRPPKRDAPLVHVSGEAAANHYRDARARFQRGLLKMIKKDASGALDMHAAVLAVEAAQTVPAQRAFWWATIAFFEAIAARALPDDPRLARLANRVEQQIKRMIEGSATVAERLMREVLFQVARSKPATERIREVQDVFGLVGTVPGAFTVKGRGDAAQPSLAAVREAIGQAKASWNKLASGTPASLAPFRDQTATLKARAATLANADFARLAAGIADFAESLAGQAGTPGDAVAMEVATALLLAESAVEKFDALAPEFGAQVSAVVARLADCARGEAPQSAPEVPLLDEMSRRAQERLLMAQVVSEIQANLRTIEQALDTFFRDPTKRDELAALDRPAKQVQGALLMLGEEAAAKVLGDSAAAIARFAQPDYEPAQSDFERVAGSLSGLGFYVDALQHGKADFETVMKPIAPAKPAPIEEVEPAAAQATVETELAQARRQAKTLFEAWCAAPADAGLRAELRENLAAIQKDAGLVADVALEAEAAKALTLIDIDVTQPRDPAFQDAMVTIAGIVPEAPAPSAEVAKLAEATTEAIDAELLEIFLEEAAEVLETIASHLEAARSDPHAIEELRTIRRGFHTLKGSGRMVGLTRLGEAAWSVERVMNRWLEDERAATPDLMKLIGAAHAYFASGVASLRAGGGSPDEQAIVALAERVGRGESIGEVALPETPATQAARPVLVEPGPPAELEGEALDFSAPAAEPIAAGDALSFDLAAPAAPEAPPVELGGSAPDAGLGLDFALPEPAQAEPPKPDTVTPGAGEAVLDFSAPGTPAPSAAPASGAEAMPTLDFDLAPAAPATEGAGESALDFSRPETPALPVDAAAAAAETPEDDVVRIGDIELSRALYTIFLEEGRSHLDAMREEAVALAQGEPVSERFHRAAHTLAGIAGTVRLDAMRELGHALELALVRLAGKPAPGAAQALFAEARDALEVMQQAAGRGELPAPTPALVARLDAFGEVEAPPPATAVPPTPAKIVTLRPPVEEPPEPPPLAAVVVEEIPVERRQQRVEDEIDPQLLEVFLEEASDLVPSIGETLREWRSAPGNAAPAQGLKRLLHTLKGSARMCGAMGLGELAHAMETRIEDAIAANAFPESLFDELDGSYDRIGLLHDRLQSGAHAAAAEPAPIPSAVPSAPPSAPIIEGVVAPAAEVAEEPVDVPVERRQQRLRDEIDPQLLPIFLEEATELVPSVGESLREWRNQPGNAGAGQALQRLLHTLKGSARMCGAMALGELTHSMETKIENALAMKTLPVTLFDELETSYDRMGVLYDRLQKPQPAPAKAPAAPSAEPAVSARGAAKPAPQPAQAPTPAELGEAAARAMLRVRADMIDRLVNEAGEVSIARSRIEGGMRALKGALTELTENVSRLRHQLREIEIQAEAQLQSRVSHAHDVDPSFDPLEFDRFTRFQELTRMMAESVNDVSTVHQNLTVSVDEAESALSAQARLNRELSQHLMRIRMVPFQSVAERLHRVVRLAAKELGKRVALDIRGSQVELDRSVLERITAPFEHLLRNSVAHGIEAPADRAAAGKPELGEIRIELRQEGNEIMLAVVDDGAGLNLARIREKAIASGLIAADAEVPDQEIAELIFHSGLSTATEVSQISGRGVGMDVVRSEIQALGGRIETSTEPGRGTRFTMYLPLTLAVTQAVLVRAAGATFAIPSALIEQVRQAKEPELAEHAGNGYVPWQDRRYPLRYLPRLLGDTEFVPEARRLTPIVFARSGANMVALQIDEILGNQEIVVKNAGPLLSRIVGITGATVLGSGEIVLIINPVLLAGRAPVETAEPVAARKAPEPAELPPTVMIVDDSLTVRKITGRLLAREGYNVIVAKDGVDATEQLQEVVPDAMLVDIEMPRMDGFELSRNVRGDARLKDVPIIMITSRTAEKHRTVAREIGVNAYLGKPFQEDELLAHLARLVGRRVAQVA